MTMLTAVLLASLTRPRAVNRGVDASWQVLKERNVVALGASAKNQVLGQAVYD